jgi:orotidine-5'-phosphate decarboxylase
MTGRDRIIVALDLADGASCRKTLETLGPEPRIVKIGSVLFGAEGPSIVRLVSSSGLKVFLDLKFHDIPNTVAGAVSAVCRQAPVAFLTVHAGGGGEMIRAARNAAEGVGIGERPRILAVTILTSLSEANLREIGFSPPDPGVAVERLARLAVSSGADGIVCSPKEVERLRRVLPRDVTLVIPGIRPASAAKDDQERTAGAREAIRAGADYLVVGRPITAAPDPRAAFLALAAEAEA